MVKMINTSETFAVEFLDYIV